MPWLRAVPLTALLLAPPLRAQEHPVLLHDPAAGDDPVVAALLREALERNPELRAAEAMVAEAGARPPQATALPEPMVSVLYTNEGWAPNLGQNEFTTLGILWTQELPGKGKRGLRGEVLRQDTALAQQQLARVRLGLMAGVRRAYHELIHARELLDLLREQEVLYDTVVAASRERYAAGQGSQADLLRAQAERLRLGLARAERATAEAVGRAELNRLLSRPPDMAVETAAHPALQPVAGSLDELVAAAETVSPEVKAAQISVERERSALALARRSGQLDWSVAVGYQNRGGLPGMWQAGFGVRLPLWREKVKASVAEADARAHGSEQRLHATRLLLRLRTEERVVRARAIEETSRLYSEGLVPQDRLAWESALAAYETGRGTFTAVLDTVAALFSDREAELRLQADHQIVMAALAEGSLESTASMGGGRP
jgi:cobalt-zinc-cadmium efflux system outer membrane protein